jgi:hypothetical protein
MLARSYLVVGLLALGLAALFLRTLVRLPGDGPHEIAFAIALVVLVTAQAVPAAGVPAALWLRVPAWHPDRWPRRLWSGLAALGAMLFVVEALFGGGPPALMTFLLVIPFALGARLAKLLRAWIAVWLVGSVVAFGLATMAIAIARG